VGVDCSGNRLDDRGNNLLLEVAMESTCKLPKEECNIRYCPFDPYECETGREVMREAAELIADQKKENIKGGNHERI